MKRIVTSLFICIFTLSFISSSNIKANSEQVTKIKSYQNNKKIKIKQDGTILGVDDYSLHKPVPSTTYHVINQNHVYYKGIYYSLGVTVYSHFQKTNDGRWFNSQNELTSDSTTLTESYHYQSNRCVNSIYTNVGSCVMINDNGKRALKSITYLRRNSSNIVVSGYVRDFANTPTTRYNTLVREINYGYNKRITSDVRTPRNANGVISGYNGKFYHNSGKIYARINGKPSNPTKLGKFPNNTTGLFYFKNGKLAAKQVKNKHGYYTYYQYRNYFSKNTSTRVKEIGTSINDSKGKNIKTTVSFYRSNGKIHSKRITNFKKGNPIKASYYRYNKASQLRSNKYGKSYRYTTTFFKKWIKKVVRSQYNKRGKLLKGKKVKPTSKTRTFDKINNKKFI